MVVEGADGVGKSTVLRLLLPKLMKSGEFSGFRFFHWKPLRMNIRDGEIPETVPRNPRSKPPRNVFLSLLYLCYHWLTFMVGYMRFVRPVLKCNYLVIADRYAYDVLLDPKRFRIRLPDMFLRLFVRTLPHPDITLAFVADPATIISRKPELSIMEIELYQSKIQSGVIPYLKIVNAEPSPAVVTEKALEILGDVI